MIEPCGCEFSSTGARIRHCGKTPPVVTRYLYGSELKRAWQDWTCACPVETPHREPWECLALDVVEDYRHPRSSLCAQGRGRLPGATRRYEPSDASRHACVLSARYASSASDATRAARR